MFENETVSRKKRAPNPDSEDSNESLETSSDGCTTTTMREKQFSGCFEVVRQVDFPYSIVALTCCGDFLFGIANGTNNNDRMNKLITFSIDTFEIIDILEFETGTNLFGLAYSPVDHSVVVCDSKHVIKICLCERAIVWKRSLFRNDCCGIQVDKRGIIYCAMRKEKIITLVSHDGFLLEKVNHKKRDLFKFRNDHISFQSFALDQSDNFVVLEKNDLLKCVLRIISRQGKELQSVKLVGFTNPCISLVVDGPIGNIIFYFNQGITMLDKNLETIKIFQGSQFNRLAKAHNGNLYVIQEGVRGIIFK